jgi:hypothetical protein
MTIRQKPPQRGDRHARQGWYTFGHAEEAVRHTEAWEHETFEEEQARWERDDPAYARICEAVRQTKDRGDEASLRADDAKAEWDARVATQREANDEAQKERHASNANPTPNRRRTATARTVSSRRPKSRSLRSSGTSRLVIRAREGHHHMHTTFAMESNDSPVPGIMPEPARVHDEPAAPNRRAERRAARRARVLSPPGQRNSVSTVLTKLKSVIRGDK